MDVSPGGPNEYICWAGHGAPVGTTQCQLLLFCWRGLRADHMLASWLVACRIWCFESTSEQAQDCRSDGSEGVAPKRRLFAASRDSRGAGRGVVCACQLLSGGRLDACSRRSTLYGLQAGAADCAFGVRPNTRAVSLQRTVRPASGGGGGGWMVINLTTVVSRSRLVDASSQAAIFHHHLELASATALGC
ncbi:hypothetical protein BDV95DRAFT_334945 [Massariosphaeria phaeospora]|uniref:Uncharacterized protein n=1 Tax=Massariosphaeria phaeospora TaxID=100035 RepID=A0A7C8IEV0_9PLEO|nr:hypothetical protein BDV95DRAFT_334945 [Massariosphaeria phaeospora]